VCEVYLSFAGDVRSQHLPVAPVDGEELEEVLLLGSGPVTDVSVLFFVPLSAIHLFLLKGLPFLNTSVREKEELLELKIRYAERTRRAVLSAASSSPRRER
jgi:hypothetical protein